jgi:hypothetical protein
MKRTICLIARSKQFIASFFFLFTTLCAIALFASGTEQSFAQTTITQQQVEAVFSPGRSVRIYQDTSSKVVNVGLTGGPHVYDFSTLPFFFAGRESVLAVSQIPQLVSRYGTATAVLRTQEGSGGFIYNPMQIDAQGWRNLGEAHIGTGLAERYRHYAPFEFDAHFPITFGHTTTQTFSTIETTYVSGGSPTMSSTVLAESLIVDGYGTLLLPGLSLNCLRVRKKEYQNGTYHGFHFMTSNGASLVVSSRNHQPGTGNIQVEGVLYVLGDLFSSIPRSEEQPHQYRLLQNFPNPFNPSTTITFGVPRSSHVILKLYNFLGQEIQTLVNEQLHPGQFEVQWHADGMASGVYFYRIQAGDFSESRKLLLAK